MNATKTAVKRFVRNHIDLAYADAGAGRPVVLVHGFPLDRSMWDDQVEALASEYRILTPDLRGFGDSEIDPGDAHAGVAMTDYAADLVAMLDDAGVSEPVALAGFSMGGYIAWQFALRYPERLAGLILADTRAAADAPEGAEGRRKMASQVLTDDSPAAAEGMLPKLLSKAALDSRHAAFERTIGMIRGASPAGIASAQRGMAVRPDVRGQLGEIRCPALVIAGAEDAISPPAEMREIAAALPNAEFVEIPAAGHMSPIENPQAFTAALRGFLAALPS